EMTFITATTMPLLIALTEIGLHDGVMLPSNAAALVGAGALSVLIFPLVAATLHKRSQQGPPDQEQLVPEKTVPDTCTSSVLAAMNAASVLSDSSASRLRSSAATSTP